MTQFQQIIVTELADRHGTPHERAFARSLEIVVTAEPLQDVLSDVSAAVAESGWDLGPGRYSITIGEPYDEEET